MLYMELKDTDGQMLVIVSRGGLVLPALCYFWKYYINPTTEGVRSLLVSSVFAR